jgi:hypothetical protein
VPPKSTQAFNPVKAAKTEVGGAKSVIKLVEDVWKTGEKRPKEGVKKACLYLYSKAMAKYAAVAKRTT